MFPPPCPIFNAPTVRAASVPTALEHLPKHGQSGSTAPRAVPRSQPGPGKSLMEAQLCSYIYVCV